MATEQVELEMEPEQDVPESPEPEQAVPEESLEPDVIESLEPVELDPDELAGTEREVLEEPTSSEEEPLPPKRVRVKAPKAAPKAPKAKAEPKKRGRPPGSRNIRAPPTPAPYDPMAIIMSSMRERRQAHQEKQHMFFQSFLP